MERNFLKLNVKIKEINKLPVLLIKSGSFILIIPNQLRVMACINQRKNKNIIFTALLLNWLLNHWLMKNLKE